MGAYTVLTTRYLWSAKGPKESSHKASEGAWTGICEEEDQGVGNHFPTSFQEQADPLYSKLHTSKDDFFATTFKNIAVLEP